MTPYGYHNSEIARMSRSERENVREAIRQAKLVQRQAALATRAATPDGEPKRAGRIHRLLGYFMTASYLRHSGTQSR